jgi:hypothetical protein
LEQESEPEFLKINVFWGKKVCNCGVKCNFQNMLLETKSDFQNSNLNFIGKKSDPRVPLSCGTGTRTILNLFLIKWKMEVHNRRQESPTLVNSGASLLHEFCDQILCQALNLISLQLYLCPFGSNS